MVTKINKTLCAALFVGSIAFPVAAWADCNSISENEDWRVNLNDVAAFHDHGDYAASLSVAQDMLKVCDKSPALNYYIAIDYQALNDNVKALEYILKASDSLIYMATSEENEQKIRRKRSELEIIVTGESASDIKEQLVTEYRHLMWGGGGAGIGGVLLTLAGGATVWANNSPSSKNAGYAILGIGMVLLVGGSVLAGIYGYKYTHLDLNKGKSLAWGVTPMSAGISLTF